MKKILSILSVLIGLFASAQNPVIVSQPYLFQNIVKFSRLKATVPQTNSMVFTLTDTGTGQQYAVKYKIPKTDTTHIIYSQGGNNVMNQDFDLGSNNLFVSGYGLTTSIGNNMYYGGLQVRDVGSNKQIMYLDNEGGFRVLRPIDNSYIELSTGTSLAPYATIGTTRDSTIFFKKIGLYNGSFTNSVSINKFSIDQSDNDNNSVWTTHAARTYIAAHSSTIDTNAIATRLRVTQQVTDTGKALRPLIYAKANKTLTFSNGYGMLGFGDLSANRTPYIDSSAIASKPYLVNNYTPLPISLTKWSQLGNSLADSTTKFLGSTNSMPLVLRTNNTERMRIQGGTGYVGIGTTTSLGRLDVVGTKSGLGNICIGNDLKASTRTLNTSKNGAITHATYGNTTPYTLIAGSSFGSGDNYVLIGRDAATSDGLANNSSTEFYTAGTRKAYITTFFMVDGINLLINTGKVGIGANTPSYDLSIGGNVARSLGMEANTVSNTRGLSLTINGGSRPATGSTDKGSDGLVINPTPATTGTADAQIRFNRMSSAISTGTTDNVLSSAMIIPNSKLMANNSAINLFNVACATGTSAGVEVHYTIKTQAGAGNKSHTETGILFINAANDGSVTVDIERQYSQRINDAGTYSVTFAYTAANPSVISVTANSSLAVNSKISYTIPNKDEQNIIFY